MTGFLPVILAQASAAFNLYSLYLLQDQLLYIIQFRLSDISCGLVLVLGRYRVRGHDLEWWGMVIRFRDSAFYLEKVVSKTAISPPGAWSLPCSLGSTEWNMLIPQGGRFGVSGCFL